MNPFKKDTDIPIFQEMEDNPDYWRKQKHYVWKWAYMTPDEYIRHCKKYQRNVDQAIYQPNVDGIAEAIQKGKKFYAPYIEYSRYGFAQEGRHRALAAKKLGIKKIPVFLAEYIGDKDWKPKDVLVKAALTPLEKQWHDLAIQVEKHLKTDAPTRSDFRRVAKKLGVKIDYAEHAWNVKNKGHIPHYTRVPNVSMVIASLHALANEITAGTKLLYHTTGEGTLKEILKSKKLRPGNGDFISLSEKPLFGGDISESDVAIGFDMKALARYLLRVRYDEAWFEKHYDQASYIAGEGWREQFTYPEDCVDDEGWEDDECMEDAYRDAELDSFEAKDDEDEWVSKRENQDIRFKPEDVRIVVNGDKPLERWLAANGYSHVEVT